MSAPGGAAPGPAGEEELRAFIQRRTGFVLPEDRWRFLAPRFLARLAGRGFADVAAYVRYLEHDPRGRTELDELFNILTVRKTSFFRNPACFAAIEQDVLPRLLAGRASRLPISLWSAGCSTGEESWSLAMIAHRLLRPLEQPYQILATDIVREALDRAREGAYAEAARAEVPAAYQGLLRPMGERVRVADEVRQGVELALHNLVHEPPPRPATGQWDVIFCRNVLIYFGLTEAREVLSRLGSVLAPGGALFLGHAEVFIDMERDYEVVFWRDTFYYRRRAPAPRLAHGGLGGRDAGTPPAGTPRPGTPSAGGPRPATARHARPGQARLEPAGGEQDTPTRALGHLRGAARPPRDAGAFHDSPTDAFRVRAVGDTPTRAFERPAWGLSAADDTRADLRPAGRPVGLPREQLVEAERRLAADDLEGAARALRAAIARAPRWGRPRLLLARVHLRLGQADQALRQLEAAVEVEPLEARAHCLLGATLRARGELARAEEALRRALYLEPDYALARRELARTHLAAGRPDRARRELRSALRAFRTVERARLLAIHDGEPLDALRRGCEQDLDELPAEGPADRPPDER